MSGRRTITRPGKRRGFALPLVMLLAVVGMIAATMIVEFQARARLGELRQIETCRAHHEQQGLAETIELWFRFGRPPAIQGDGSIGFVVRGERREEYRVEVSDAQGRLLDSPTAMAQEDEDVAACYQRAVQMLQASEAQPERYLRKRGPAAVNVNAATRAVLEALARSVDDSGAARRFASLVAEQRAERKIDAGGLQRLISEAGITDAAQAELMGALFTTESMLRRVDVQVRDPVRRTIARHTGLLLGENPRAGQLGAGNNRWAFLTWERVVEDDPGQQIQGPGR